MARPPADRPEPHAAPLTWGPLALPSRAPIFDTRTSYTPGRVRVLGKHHAEAMFTASQVNVWAQMPGYFLDGEWSRLDVRLAYGLGHRTEVRLSIGGMHRSGGNLDGFIEGFHSAFGITQARRDRYPANRLHVETFAQNNTKVWLDDMAAGFGVTNPVVAVRYGVLARGPDAAPTLPRVSFDLAVKLPLGSIARQFATQRVTLLADVALEQPVTPWLAAFVTYGLMLSPGIAPFYGMPMSEVQKFLSVGLVFVVAADAVVTVQYLNQDGGIENAAYTPMERTTHEFGLGVKWAPLHTERLVIEAGVIENTVHDANTPDFGFTLGVRLHR